MNTLPFPDADVSADDERRARVALSLTPGVGAGRIRSLVAAFGSAHRARQAPSHHLARVPGIGPATAQAIRAFRDDAAVEAQFEAAERVGARLVLHGENGTPSRLSEIYDPPAFLWMRGTLEETDRRAIAIVGTRRATDYGIKAAERFAHDLAAAGFTIVSGLAYGIDAAAHRAALDAGGRTLAVLGSGVDRIYPSRHTRLAMRILDAGAVLSEYPMGAAPDAPNFPRRNRIVSGLAAGVLVVEAFEKGGALITARVAIEQNREVFAVPAPFDLASGAGTNRLIQRGHAKLVLTADDVLEELGEAVSTAAPPAPTPDLTDLNDIERTLYDALTTDAVHIDALCATTNLDTSSALVYLLSLEFKGLVRQLAGKQFLARMSLVLFLLAALLAIFTLIPFVRHEVWWIRVFDFPRLQVAFLCAVVLALLLVFHDSGWMTWAGGVLAAVSLLIHGLVVLRYTPAWPKEVEDAEGGHPTLKLLIANVLMKNRENAGLFDFIDAQDPDLIILDEPDSWWEEQFRRLESRYPHTLKNALPNTYGMLLYSKKPFLEAEKKNLIEEGVPSFHVTIALDGQEVRLHFIHPKPPFPKEAKTTAGRDAELIVVGKMAAEESRPTLVAGDLNDVAWSRTTTLFQKTSRLLDPRKGRGLYNTFHADHFLVRWPLDHLFHSDHFRLVRLERGPAYGSDHFPMFVELELDPTAQPEQEAPEQDADDAREADEKLQKERRTPDRKE